MVELESEQPGPNTAKVLRFGAMTQMSRSIRDPDVNVVRRRTFSDFRQRYTGFRHWRGPCIVVGMMATLADRKKHPPDSSYYLPLADWLSSMDAQCVTFVVGPRKRFSFELWNVKGVSIVVLVQADGMGWDVLVRPTESNKVDATIEALDAHVDAVLARRAQLRATPDAPPPTVTVTMTHDQALALGLLRCECGHPPNNHFDFDKRPCAHCRNPKCEEYRERVSLPKVDA